MLIRHDRDLLRQLRQAQAGLAERARAQERNRIARELHDVIGHTLTVSLLHVQSARLAVEHDPADAARALAEAERLGRECLATVEATAPDVVLMDVRMPFTDGVQATVQLRQRQGSPPVLALTTFDDDQALAGMLRAGAPGFVLKGVPAEDLQRAVRTVAEGAAWLDPAVTGRVLATYRSAPAELGTDGAAQ